MGEVEAMNPLSYLDPFDIASGSNDAMMACIVLALAGIVFCASDLDV